MRSLVLSKHTDESLDCLQFDSDSDSLDIQHVRVGKMALVAGLAKVVKDVLPYMIVDGNPARCRGINTVGLLRNEVGESSRRRLKTVYRILCRSSLNTRQALVEIEQEVDNCPEIAHLIDFVRRSKRGICK